LQKAGGSRGGGRCTKRGRLSRRPLQKAGGRHRRPSREAGGRHRRPLQEQCPGVGCPNSSTGHRARADTRRLLDKGVDVSCPTSILRPACLCCHTVLSSARSGVRGTQRSERPATMKMLARRYVSSSHVHSACCTHVCTYMHRRACANARVVSCVSRTCAAFYTFAGDRMPARDWSPRVNILSLRHVASQASSIHLPHHGVNKFVLIVSNLPRAKFSQQKAGVSCTTERMTRHNRTVCSAQHGRHVSVVHSSLALAREEVSWEWN
jgi:hypothetical protein